jgi:pimeloyl-ACP methyl ester carboxylesterase
MDETAKRIFLGPGALSRLYVHLRKFACVSTLLLVGTAARAAEPSDIRACTALVAVKDHSWQVESAQWQEAGFMTPETAADKPHATASPICRVVAKGTPSPGSAIGFEVWLPSQRSWNGKVLGIGGGGLYGAVDYASLDEGVQKHYATVSSDYGHISKNYQDATWARDQPERVIDYGYRAQHLVTVAAKRIAALYNGRRPSRAYYLGCSQGGRMAMVEATRYAGDYDGIIAGAPPTAYAKFIAGIIWSGQAALRLSPQGLSRSMTQVLQRGVLARCGSPSGRIEDPSQCRFDPAELRCNGVQAAESLTDVEVEVARDLYAGPKDAQGHPIGAGLPYGSELSWRAYVNIPPGDVSYYASPWLLHEVVYAHEQVDLRSIDVLRAFRDAQVNIAPLFDAPPELSAFERRGGKLIMFHGWADATIPPQPTIDFVAALVARLGPGRVDQFVRLFMVPGLGHCSNPDGSQQFGQEGLTPAPGDPERDVLATLDRWVESGTAPEHIIATTTREGKVVESQTIQRFDTGAMRGAPPSP